MCGRGSTRSYFNSADPATLTSKARDRSAVACDDQPLRENRIPINESQDDRARSRNTCASIMVRAFSTLHSERMTFIGQSMSCGARRGVPGAPDSYYEGVDARVQGHRESLAALKDAPF